MKPAWMLVAERYLGLKEGPGKENNSVILGWLKKLKAWWSEDETPWCGTFVAECLNEAGLAPSSAWFRASAWKTYGVEVSPQFGAILVFVREGGGHVGFYCGEDDNYYYVLGGNQGNSVSRTWISKNRLVACRWPAGVAVPNAGRVRLTRAGKPVSTNEA